MNEIDREILRLKEKGIGSGCVDDIKKAAELIVNINRLKKEKKAVIASHVYQRPEIVSGISDFVGDSYKLAKDCSNVDADVIIFCGVNFMGETAKILNPQKRVFVPSKDAGCSLSDSITAGDVIELKKKYPGVPVVAYINTKAEVKAESDVVVTSSSAFKILKKMFERYNRVIFIPDKYMGLNLARELNKKPYEELILSNGSCIVHEKFDPSIIKYYRKKYPDMMVMAHTECPTSIIENVDFMGSTSDMMKQIELTNALCYMLITECGLGELATITYPEKKFIAMCRICPYMKSITLEKVYETLKNLPEDLEIKLESDIIKKAKRSIDMMFELAG